MGIVLLHGGNSFLVRGKEDLCLTRGPAVVIKVNVDLGADAGSKEGLNVLLLGREGQSPHPHHEAGLGAPGRSPKAPSPSPSPSPPPRSLGRTNGRVRDQVLWSTVALCVRHGRVKVQSFIVASIRVVRGHDVTPPSSSSPSPPTPPPPPSTVRPLVPTAVLLHAVGVEPLPPSPSPSPWRARPVVWRGAPPKAPPIYGGLDLCTRAPKHFNIPTV